MEENLDLTPTEFRNILDQTTSFVLQHYQKIDDIKGYNSPEQSIVENWFDEPLPQLGMSVDTIFDEIQTKVFDAATGNLGRHMYGYVMSGGNQVSTIAELLMATVNQNNTKWHLAPSMTEIEKRVSKWASEMIGFTPQAGGAMVSGGSEANLAGLTVARNVFFQQFDIAQNGLFGLKPFTIYCSTETHNSIDKSIVMLGIGTNQIRKIATNDDFTINLQKLENQIETDIENGFKPFCIVGNAGTVNTGAIDDLTALADIAQKHNLWLHTDGAYGGLIASLSEFKEQYKGIERADSVALDFHKWLYQPFEIGCILVKSWDILKQTYFKKADYLLASKSNRLEYNEHYFQLSRNAKAFKVWVSLKAYGFEKIQAMMRKDIDLTHYLAQLITQSDDFELKSKPILGVLCFSYTKNIPQNEQGAFNQKLVNALETDGRVFVTGTKLNGIFVLRACIINHRKQKVDIEYLVNCIRDVAETLVMSK